MRKMTCVLLLIKVGFMMAQTKTLVTQNGEKVTINPIANNGLTADNGSIQFGGILTKPSVLTTTSAFTLAIQGLQAGTASDNVLVSDANGVLKYVSRANFGGDNLGDHTATQNLMMNRKEIEFADKVIQNPNSFSLFKNNGIFGIRNNYTSSNAFTINEMTNRTTLQSVQISNSADGNIPAAGYIATSTDAAGSVAWRPINQISGTSSIQFFVQSTGQTTNGATSWNNIPGLANFQYTAPADGDLIMTTVLYSAMGDTPPNTNLPSIVNTQMQILVNGANVAYGMSSPIAAGATAMNCESTTMLTKFTVTKGTTYTITIQAKDVWKTNSTGAYVGTFKWNNVTTDRTPSTMMGTLITR